ncbi:hypothetical protein Pelo_3240 [Pelomyxa schiedti]|nr:hypothetical protein Pelo_3240 [Pelomyxa schiedti]
MSTTCAPQAVTQCCLRNYPELIADPSANAITIVEANDSLQDVIIIEEVTSKEDTLYDVNTSLSSENSLQSSMPVSIAEAVMKVHGEAPGLWPNEGAHDNIELCAAGKGDQLQGTTPYSTNIPSHLPLPPPKMRHNIRLIPQPPLLPVNNPHQASQLVNDKQTQKTPNKRAWVSTTSSPLPISLCYETPITISMTSASQSLDSALTQQLSPIPVVACPAPVVSILTDPGRILPHTDTDGYFSHASDDDGYSSHGSGVGGVCVGVVGEKFKVKTLIFWYIYM